jgi:capsular polysaccharide biosynthesis protein
MTVYLEEPGQTPSGGLVPYERLHHPRVSISWALRRYWLTALLPLVLFVAAAVYTGVSREPNYTAETKLTAGRVDSGTPTSALAGFTTATQSLAETYSRSIHTDRILRKVAAATGTSPSLVSSSVTAAPIPNTPVFQVDAKASSPHLATKLSVLSSEALVRDVGRNVRVSRNSEELFSAYKAAAARENLAREQYRSYRMGSASQSQLATAQTELKAASLRADALRQSYLASSQNQTGTAVPQIIGRASDATSDRGRIMQILLFIAVVAGIVVGTALALIRGHREARRLLAT